MIITTLITAFLLILAYILYLEISNILILKCYKSQGVKTYYKPLTGLVQFLIDGGKTNDQDSAFKKIFSENNDADLIAVNQSGAKGAVIYLKSPKAVAGLVKIEKKLKKVFLFNTDFFGFFALNGNKAMRQKSVFAKIFHQDNLETLCPMLAKLVDSHLNKLKNTKNIGREWTQIDLKEDVFRAFFEDFTFKILFGNKEIKEIPRLENGDTIVTANSKVLSLYFQIASSKLRAITFGLAEKLNILKEKREFLKIRAEVKKLVIKMYKERLSSGSKGKTVNFMDSLIEHNESCKEEERMNLEEISSNFELFQGAGSDTSFQVTTSTLVLLSKKENRKAQELLMEEVDKMPKNASELDRNQLESSELLMNIINESMRVNSPINQNSPRIAVEDVQIAGKKVYKGDLIFVAQSGMNFNPKIHKDPGKFDVERFGKNKKILRNSFIPFSVGKRKCVGKYLAEMVVRITISRFLKMFEVKEVEGFDYRLIGFSICGYEKAMVNVKLR